MAVDCPLAIGDGPFAGAHVFDPAGISCLGPTIGDNPQASHLFETSGIRISWRIQLLEVPLKLCPDQIADATFLHFDVEHQGRSTPGGNAVCIAEREGLFIQRSSKLDLDILEFLPPAQRFELPLPRLKQNKSPQVLNRASPGELFLAAGPQHGLEYRVVPIKDSLQDLGIIRIHLLKKRLKAALAQVPLKHTEADALAIKITRKAGKTIGEGPVCFEGACEGHAPEFEWLVRDERLLDLSPGEKGSPGLRSNSAIHDEGVSLLKGCDRYFCPASENSIDGAEVNSEFPQASLNLRDFWAN